MKLLEPLTRQGGAAAVEQRYTLTDVIGWMKHAGHQYMLGPQGSRPDIPEQSFAGLVAGVHRAHSPVSAAVVARALLMSQLRFQWRSHRDGERFGTPGLSVLERPGGPRPDLLYRMELDVSYAGTAVVVRPRAGRRIMRVAPDRVTFVLASDSEPSWDGDVAASVPFDTEVIAVVYNDGVRKTAFLRGEFAIWAPEPDPVHFWRGTSWITSLLREIAVDRQAVDHQGKFFENAATPNLVFKMDPAKTPDEVRAFAAALNETHAGTDNAHKNMFLGGATDVMVVGSMLESLALKDLQGGIETRISMRSRVPAVVLGAREGLAGSSLNTGNYNAARRLLADGWFTPTAEGLCAALEAVVPPPDGSELSYDPARVLFLQEDQKDEAEISRINAVTLRQLVEAGYDPQTAIEAVKTGDLSKLVHTGNVSVQLQPPGSGLDE